MSALVNIRKRERGLKIPTTNVAPGYERKAVSQWSKYRDPVWTLSSTLTIYWLRLPQNQTDINQDAFNSLMTTVKRMTYLLMIEEEFRPQTIYTIVQMIKMFSCWILSQTTPLKRFCDVQPSTISEYFEHLGRRPSRLRSARTGRDVLKGETVRVHARALLQLYRYKDRVAMVYRISEPFWIRHPFASMNRTRQGPSRFRMTSSRNFFQQH